MLRYILSLFTLRKMINVLNKVAKFLSVIVLLLYIPNSALRVFVFCTFLFCATMSRILYYKSLPPGPWGVPLLGYLPFMSNKPPHKLYIEMSAKYGDVFSVQLGTNLVVGIGSAKLMKELFNRPDSAGRPNTPLNALLGGLGIVTSEGLLWKRQRRFLQEKFRALGVKLSPNGRFEKYIIEEVKELVSILHETSREAVDPRQILGRHIHNVICQLMMSYRFDRNNVEFTMFNERVSRGMKLFGMVHMGEHFKPYLHLPGKQAIMKEIQRNIVDVSKFHADYLEKRIKERSTSGVNAEPADLLDCYLDHQNKDQICFGVEPDKQIVQTMNDLFSAGMDTTLSTLLWSLVMMLREPEPANKVRTELKNYVKPGQLITMEHRLSMPYTEAVLFETMRMLSVVPLGTIHVNETDWTVEGYTIPAGTHIVPLINRMNMDSELYPEPEKFKPERFIVDGKCHAINFLQFGVGQRMCLGNMLARIELFLIFANIMNTFDFSLPVGEPVPELEGVLGAIHAPLPFKLSFTKME